tara:strand:- start:695 stop:1327 length:633 start_codon:yes stop_codon:yes gene_type:complete
MKTIKQLESEVGTLANTSKMPCFSTSTPAASCKTGGRLRKVEGSICSICYAHDGHYRYKKVQDSLKYREKCISKDLWVESMSALIYRKEKSGFFRWKDSGDIGSVKELDKIVQVCRNLPHIRFWLPTREYGFVRQWVEKNGKFPENLTVRLSAYMIDGPPPTKLAKQLGVQTSGVSASNFTCPASRQGDQCLSCRECWNRNQFTINYKEH